jgi:hypothetical protein
MKYLGHALTLIGAALILVGVFTQDWIVVLQEGANGRPDPLYIIGWDLAAGKTAAILALLVIAATITALIIRRRAVLISETLTCIFLFFALAYAAATGPAEYVTADWKWTLEVGFYWALNGTFAILIGALRVFAQGPDMHPSKRPLRVAMLWNGTIISERIFDEPHDVTIGEDIRCTFTVPEGSGISSRFTLFHGNRNGTYNLGLTRDMTGRLEIGGTRYSVLDAIEHMSSGVTGTNVVKLDTSDWGLLHVGPLAVFFQFIQPERAVSKAGLAAFDANMLATTSASALFHIGLILATLFLWTEDEDIKRRAVVFKHWDVDAIYDEEKEEEEEDEGKEEDTTGKRAEGEEGKFGDPDIDPMIESKVPQRDGKMVSKIDPEKVGLVDMLSTNKLGGMGAIANILSKNTDGLANKMAVAMAGAGTEFVMGHGSGGMGFKGTGTGGGGIGGYGRIHGLGKIDTGGGTGMHGSLGRKRGRKVGKIRIGTGKSTGFCQRGNIARVVRRRANSIRACYEQRLQVNPNLRGKLTARWTIGLNGRVASANLAGSTLGDRAVVACVLRVIRRMSFAKPEGGVCIVQWPFVFNPGS